ncbi:hypothetical protein [Pedomonas mirosovicensis]|uniref:hypothetical protein n=1 Tax=Pedomonas mirosovicensis TaxID=2908641 RepID=UPI002167BDEA|nr:hypothetical protein [Pedomonas mirosovicensis]MCH8683777.1 hypothetical protein [Pedomonas mirosovicensis]
MLIGSDPSWLNGAPKQGDARSFADRSTARNEAAAAAAGPAESQALAARTQRVIAAQSARSQNELGARNPQEREDDARRFAREAPNGERPRFIAKGQKLNVLV